MTSPSCRFSLLAMTQARSRNRGTVFVQRGDAVLSTLKVHQVTSKSLGIIHSYPFMGDIWKNMTYGKIWKNIWMIWKNGKHMEKCLRSPTIFPFCFWNSMAFTDQKSSTTFLKPALRPCALYVCEKQLHSRELHEVGNPMP